MEKGEVVLKKAIAPNQGVVVTDIDIKFWSMVQLMIKFTFAAIPAAIAIYFIGVFILGMVAGLVGR